MSTSTKIENSINTPKLELIQLTPYLPCKLKIFEGEQGEENLIRVMNLGKGRSNSWVGINTVLKSHKSNYYSFYRPILTPFSHFDGKTIKEIKDELECTHNQVMEFLCLYDDSIRLDMVTVGLFDVMCKKHIDFNNLIDKNLAIDINTITN